MYKTSRPSGDLIWPGAMAEKFYVGFDDDELELVCDWGLRGHDRKLKYREAQWIYWATELYSFGRCYREWLRLPGWFPLPLYGDHGVDLSGKLSLHEETAKPYSHLTWFSDRAKHLKVNSKKKILRIPHPWILFRRRHGLIKKTDSRGTLVFLTHSVPGIDIEGYDLDQYFSDLVSLQEEFHPIVICMHRHDIKKNVHLKIRKYGLPIISAGDTSSPYFIERFYSIISNFNYATSNDGGSDLFYCEEFGVSYFIRGEIPVLMNNSLNHLPKGELQKRDLLAEEVSLKKRELFLEFPPKSSFEKKAFVDSVLGLDVDENDARNLVIRELKKELLRHPLEVIKSLFIYSLRQTLPSIVLEWIKKLIFRVRMF